VSALTVVLSALVALQVSAQVLVLSIFVESVVVCSVVVEPPQEAKATTTANAKIVCFICFVFLLLLFIY
jgi:hypothetical protein